FVSADSIVTGAASGTSVLGTVGAEQNASLTVQYTTGATTTDNNARQAKTGPKNPQGLNRYAYVLNNPVRYADPSGRCSPDVDEFGCNNGGDLPTNADLQAEWKIYEYVQEVKSGKISPWD